MWCSNETFNLASIQEYFVILGLTQYPVQKACPVLDTGSADKVIHKLDWICVISFVNGASLHHYSTGVYTRMGAGMTAILSITNLKILLSAPDE